jgi:hypothetical protein
MNYEMHNPRPPKKSKLGSWPFWSSPPQLAFDYIIKIVMFLILLPMFFGVAFTPAGLFLNYLLIDFIIYLQYKKVT